MLVKRIASWLARGPFCGRGRRIFERNRADWNMPLGKMDKLCSGLFIILHDYGEGRFPPHFTDQETAHDAEIAIRETIHGMTPEQYTESELRKPFGGASRTIMYLRSYGQLASTLERLAIQPPAKLLELGCGVGWTAEFLALTGYEVTGTSISPSDIADARKRIESIRAKGLERSLRFQVSTMESVAETVGPRNHYDGVFVFEALHHAFDWRETIRSSFDCLKPSGWLLLCNEPNVLHTFKSYRVARLSNTHEIGFSKRDLIAELQKAKFKTVISTGPKLHWWVQPHWLLAQK
jgi:2-polyprenyl-3-methyl-5-hydroxy-6-metoxy-1,4-benzoquinol methylase